MRKHTFLAAFFSMMLGLSVISSQSYALQPGCPQEVMDAIENHAEAKRVESKAAARQVIKQNDNAPGMTCFDRAMTLTSRLGGIFSDVSPTGIIPAANESVFGTSSFPDFGATTKLIKGLDAVVSPTLQGHVTNFADSLSSLLGATVAGYMNEFVSSTLDPILDSIAGPMGTLSGYVADLNSYYSTLQTAMNILGVSMPTVVMTAVAAINAAWSAINSFISGAVAAITNAITSIVNTIVDTINSAVSSLMAAATPEGDCSRIAQLWGNDFPDGFRSLIGSAVEQGMPYFTMFQMVAGEIPDNMGTPGTHLLQEIFNSSNNSIITNALNDLLPGGALSGPGVLPSWPTPPIFGTDASLTDIISQM